MAALVALGDWAVVEVMAPCMLGSELTRMPWGLRLCPELIMLSVTGTAIPLGSDTLASDTWGGVL